MSIKREKLEEFKIDIDPRALMLLEFDEEQYKSYKNRIRESVIDNYKEGDLFQLEIASLLIAQLMLVSNLAGGVTEVLKTATELVADFEKTTGEMIEKEEMEIKFNIKGFKTK
jgi:hypothetical protein